MKNIFNNGLISSA